MEESKKLRAESLKLLATNGMNSPVTLPLIAIPNLKRTTEEVVARTLAMNVIAASAYGFDRADGANWLEREGISSSLTKGECQFLSGNGQQNYTSYPEALYAFCWILGFIPSLNFWIKCPDDLVSKLPDVRRPTSPRQWINAARLRENDQLLQNLDLAYCCHWILRDKVKGSQTFFKTDLAGVSLRRLAFEWLFTDEDWADISLDT